MQKQKDKKRTVALTEEDIDKGVRATAPTQQGTRKHFEFNLNGFTIRKKLH
jgi:hypothetical protein